jgi:hydroxymethylglutaryl-CoA reductase
MKNPTFLPGFSKQSASEKARLIAMYTADPDLFLEEIKSHAHPMGNYQKLYSEFSENTLTNYFLPYGIAPNFLINNQLYHVPMVTEESSVVAAASAAAKFWYDKGGFRAEIRKAVKKGQVHFLWKGPEKVLRLFFESEKRNLFESNARIEQQMRKRGGGILDIELLYLPEILPDYYQLDVRFETADAMGANFINSYLECLALEWQRLIETSKRFNTSEKWCEIIMSILSNYSPECIVKCHLEADLHKLNAAIEVHQGTDFARKFVSAVKIAREDVQRAVTNNKGIFNGIDSVIIATGNDFRAVEANGHAYAARQGAYRSLSDAEISNNWFVFSLEIPLMIGTVGGVTGLHPLAKRSLEILGQPNAKELMQIIASVGLASNFSAIRSLVSGGIQRGHMRLHLSNMMNQLGANDQEKKLIEAEFAHRRVSFSLVQEYLADLRCAK